MRIIIPTKGRISNQLTLSLLPKEIHDQVVIVCPDVEVYWHERNFPLVSVVSQPDANMGIAEKRKWIIENTLHDKIVMLDDDLRYAQRRTDNPTLFHAATKDDIITAFRELEDILSPEIPHAGFAARGSGIGEAAQRGGWQTTGKRMVYSLGYYIPVIRKEVILGRINTREDMDITLQLLTKGFPNAVNFSFVTDQIFGRPGGCSKERTIETSNADAIKLAEFFPGYIRVGYKEYKSSVPRLEVTVQWQKALKDGILRKKKNETSN